MSPSTFSKSFVTYILSVFLSASSYTDAPPQIKISRPVFFLFPILLLNFAPYGSFPVQPFSCRTKDMSSARVTDAQSHRTCGVPSQWHFPSSAFEFFLSSGNPTVFSLSANHPVLTHRHNNRYHRLPLLSNYIIIFSHPIASHDICQVS